MTRISIASGKGGTGKTLVATNLAAAARDAVLMDLDVEEPNCHLFFRCEELSRETATRKVPLVRKDKCTNCGKCAEVCEFRAIAVLPKEVLVFDELCHGCGACSMFCPEDAIEERDHPIGEVLRCRAEDIRELIYGRLLVGEAMATNLIRRVKKSTVGDDGLVIIDCPPGTGCPAMESMRGSDLCVLVTEPTPFGLHDLDLSLKVAKKLRLRYVVLINKAGLPGPDIRRFCKERDVPVIGEIPMDRKIAEVYSEGKLLIAEQELKNMFEAMIERIFQEAEGV